MRHEEYEDIEDVEDSEDDTPDEIPDLTEPCPVAELKKIKKDTEEVLEFHGQSLRGIKKCLRQAQTKLRQLRKKDADQKDIAMVEHMITTLEERAKTATHAIEKFKEQEKQSNAKLNWMSS